MLLELCAYNIQSCLVAEAAGAGRIELCSDPAAGGTTPGYGLVTYCLERLSIPVFPMVRPRGGNFFYDADEVEIIKRDILHFRRLGCKGIATGCHGRDMKIDRDLLSKIVEWAGPMEVTCHKVFDRSPDATEALEAVITAGCSRVLTSGLSPTAVDGAANLAMLRDKAAERIVIMPGGGVRSGNLAALIDLTGCSEFHSSGILTGNTSFTADAEEVEDMVNTLNRRAS